MNRIYTKLGKNDLKELRKLALEEHENFFERNPHLKRAYYNSLIGICLCQGAASHYLNPKVGIKDFDIWHFYAENGNIGFPYRAHKVVENGYKHRGVDFLKRAIPKRICKLYPNDPDKCIMEHLLERDTATKRFLLKKVVIGLFPKKIFSKIIWRGERVE